ncbi:MAG: hypothetical protein WEB60_04975 [Terrimicrobiaceae bacterium]
MLLDKLDDDSTAIESHIDTTLQQNLWIFDKEYSLMESSRQLQTIVKDFTDKIYKAKDPTDRPDLCESDSSACRGGKWSAVLFGCG